MSERVNEPDVVSSYMTTDAFIRGRRVREAVMGESHVERSLDTAIQEGNSYLQ